jgi:hypothetical protein
LVELPPPPVEDGVEDIAVWFYMLVIELNCEVNVLER